MREVARKFYEDWKKKRASQQEMKQKEQKPEKQRLKRT